MQITLKAACSFLTTRGYKVDISSMKQAARSGTLKAEMITGVPTPYYATTVQDAVEWAKSRKRGRPKQKKAQED